MQSRKGNLCDLLSPEDLQGPGLNRLHDGKVYHAFACPLKHWCGFMQERLWKLNVAKQLVTEAARFDRRKQLKPADSEIGEEVRAGIAEALSVQVQFALSRVVPTVHTIK